MEVKPGAKTVWEFKATAAFRLDSLEDLVIELNLCTVLHNMQLVVSNAPFPPRAGSGQLSPVC